jgi:hypothetical protein
MRGRPASALLLLCVVSIAAACTTRAGAPHPAKPATEHAATPEATPNGGHALGAPGCRPASPVTVVNRFLAEVEGTGHGATLWGLLMFPHPLPARVGDQEKIVWRMTGSSWPLALAAIGPDGTRHPLLWGPAAHLPGSNWPGKNKPGDEWGAGYVFTEPGCWDLRAVRGGATADVWLTVIPRSQQI